MIAQHPGECKDHEYQDHRYGKGFRVMNPTKDGGWRCTVCAPPKEHSKKRGGVFQKSDLRILRGI